MFDELVRMGRIGIIWWCRGFRDYVACVRADSFVATVMNYSSSLAVETPVCTEGAACDYRLARKPNGDIILQTCHFWTCGADHGWEWRDRETVNYETAAPTFRG